MTEQNLTIQKNKYDKTGECLQTGLGAEQLFDQIAESKSLEIKNAKRRENMQKHIDKYVTDDVGTWSVDIKARKKTSRSNSQAQDDWIWIEFQNVRGNAGWLYGEADRIAFETQDNFIIVDRSSLIDYVENVVDMGKSVKYSSQAQYKTYRRAGRNDLLTMVELSEIKNNCKHFVWEK
jgi:predicted Abi (CAAX) family protease